MSTITTQKVDTISNTRWWHMWQCLSGTQSIYVEQQKQIFMNAKKSHRP